MISACGFKPLHGVDGTRALALNEVWIDEINGEMGQTLRNHLIDDFYTDGYPDTARYVLRVSIRQFTRNLDVRKNDTATRAQVILRAQYQLKDRFEEEKVVHEGTLRSVNSYNILDSQFTTLVTREDAIKRGLKDLSNQIQNRITLAVAKRHNL